MNLEPRTNACMHKECTRIKTCRGSDFKNCSIYLEFITHPELFPKDYTPESAYESSLRFIQQRLEKGLSVRGERF